MFIRGNYYSRVLDRYKSYVAVVPKFWESVEKTMILLPGWGSDETAWCLNVPLEEYAETFQTAFFCVDGENSFYTDHADGEDYADAFGQEFLDTMQRTYPIPRTKAKTEIAGFSMGGYGAVLLGLRFSTRYARIGAFSPAFIFYKKTRNTDSYNHVFAKGDYGSENDCVHLYQQLFDQKRVIPKIEMACGTDDPLYAQSVDVMNQIMKINPAADIALQAQPGFHDFTLWRPALQAFLNHQLI